MKPEVLFLAHRIPYPPDKGDKTRSWHILEFLRERFRVHLAAFVDDARDLVHRNFLEARCETVSLVSIDPKLAKLKSLASFASQKPLSFGYYQDPHMAAAVKRARQRPLVMEMVFSSTMAPYLEGAKPGVKRVVDFCDSDSEKWRQYSEQSSWPMSIVYGREARLLAGAETTIANRVDASFAVTPNEAELFNARSDLNTPVDWFSNGVDTEFFDPANTEAINGNPDCMFVGAMDYRANVDGVLSFVRAVWPLVRQKKPDASFTIVGANPAASISALHGDKGITVTGRVDDVRPWLKAARTVAAPLTVARGIQNKVLEAMAMEKPVIATPAAMTGIAPPANAGLTVTDANAFADGILGLLDNDARRGAMGKAARAFVVKEFSWPARLSRLDDAFARLGLYTSSSSSCGSNSSVTN
ncbi:MAG: TIGR03087 family PEP-CTERM/XrtA system glycosyltransferase [Pseudomonadota bacterium]